MARPRWMTRKLIVAAVALALAMAGLTLVGWRHQARVAATAPVLVPMGDVTLRIPANYLFSLPGQDNPDDMNVVLYVLLPDMEPRTPANAKEFQVRGWGRTLYASIYYRGPSLTGLKLFDAMMRFAEDHVTGTDHVGPFTVTRMKFTTEDQIVFTGPRDKPAYFAQCSSLDHFSPDCKRIILIAPDIYVTYWFARSYLDDYAGIEQRLLARLNSFRIHGKPFEVIQ